MVALFDSDRPPAVPLGAQEDAAPLEAVAELQSGTRTEVEDAEVAVARPADPDRGYRIRVVTEDRDVANGFGSFVFD